MAADADVEVDHQRELPCERRRGPCGRRARRTRRRRAARNDAISAWPAATLTRAARSRARRRRRARSAARLASCGARPADAHAHVVPAGLAGDGIGVADRAARAVRQLVADQVVQEEALPRLVGAGRELPGAVGLADRVPGPHRARLDRLAVAQHAAHLPQRLSTQHQPPSAMPAAARGQRVDVQVVVAVDLAQPRVLRIPRVVHRHRPLRDRVERIGARVSVDARPRAARTRTAADRSRSRCARAGASGGWRPGRLALRREAKASAACRCRARAGRRRSSGASPCPSRSRGIRGSSCACSASSRAGGSWKTQSFFAYISHCFGFGAPRRCSLAVRAAPAHQEADARLRPRKLTTKSG